MSVRSAAAVVASFAAVAAGCAGGSDSEQEEWADSVCAPFVEWQSEVRALEEEQRAAAFQSPSGDVLETARDAGTRFVEATEDLLVQLEDVGAPPVEEDQDAADVLGGLSISLQETRDDVEEQLEQLIDIVVEEQPDQPDAESMGEAPPTWLVSGQIRQALRQVQETIATLGGMSNELQRAFADAGSCQGLREG